MGNGHHFGPGSIASLWEGIWERRGPRAAGMSSCDSTLEVHCTQLLSISMAASLSLKIGNLLLKSSRITAPQRNQGFLPYKAGLRAALLIDANRISTCLWGPDASAAAPCPTWGTLLVPRHRSWRCHLGVATDEQGHVCVQAAGSDAQAPAVPCDSLCNFRCSETPSYL